MADWFPMSGLATHTRRDGRMLTITVIRDTERWQVIAIEAVDSGENDPTAFFTAGHWHKFLGTHKRLARALRVAEKFAEKWDPAAEVDGRLRLRRDQQP